MKKLLAKITGALAFAALISCGTQPKAQNELPSWYLNTPQSAEFYYSSGAGASPSEAKLAALNAISSSIFVGLSSSLEVKKELLGDEYSRNITQDLRAQTQKINFTGAQTLQTKEIDGTFYLSLRVKKRDVFGTLQAELAQLGQDLSALSANALQSGEFYFLKNKDAFDVKLKDAFVKVTLLKAVDERYQDAPALATLNAQKESFYAHIFALKFHVQSNVKEYADTLRSHLLKLGAKSTDRLRGEKSEVSISVQASAKPKQISSDNPKLASAHFATVSLDLTTKDAAEKTLAQNRVILTNGSAKSYDDAIKRQGKFSSFITENGLVKTLTGAH